MSPLGTAPAVAASRPVTVSYASASTVAVDDAGARLSLALDGSRGAVGVRGSVVDAALVRDCLVTLASIRESDLRYRGRDRAAYLAFLMKKGKKANAQIWSAQKSFLEGEYGASSSAPDHGILDPVLTVHPDEVSVEVFSKDESTYARLALHNSLFRDRAAAHGTACVDLGVDVAEQLARVPGYRPLAVDASTSQDARSERVERRWDLPLPWLRGFLQVQSAAALPTASAELAPVDLYNVLYALRMRRAKVPPRGLRFELIPGQRPRVVVEPWDIVLEGHGPSFTGAQPRVVRIYGRQRLALLQRVLPYAQGLRVHLVGPGLPSFFCLDLGSASLTLALSGWTESSWSSAAAFDALMPSSTSALPLADRVHAVLSARGPTSFADLAHELAAPPAELRAATQLLSLSGRALFDVATQLFRPRELFREPLDVSDVRFGSLKEAHAHRLLDDDGVRLTKVHDRVGEGVEIHGEVDDVDARRTLAPRFLMDAEGRVREAACTCPAVRRSGIKEGPCEHMIALRIVYGRKRAADEALRDSDEGRKLIRAETRHYLKRNADGGAVTWRVSLDERVVFVEWRHGQQHPRSQRLWFDTDQAARDAYFSRLDALERDGFVSSDSA